jgi:tRNA(Ile2) C34 agmatinyltransferase TiaS
MNSTEAARELAAKRKPVTVVCPVCGTTATGIGTKRYCTTACAKKASRRAYYAREQAKKHGTQAPGAPAPPVGDEDLARVVEA